MWIMIVMMVMSCCSCGRCSSRGRRQWMMLMRMAQMMMIQVVVIQMVMVMVGYRRFRWVVVLIICLLNPIINCHCPSWAISILATTPIGDVFVIITTNFVIPIAIEYERSTAPLSWHKCYSWHIINTDKLPLLLLVLDLMDFLSRLLAFTWFWINVICLIF